MNNTSTDIELFTIPHLLHVDTMHTPSHTCTVTFVTIGNWSNPPQDAVILHEIHVCLYLYNYMIMPHELGL